MKTKSSPPTEAELKSRIREAWLDHVLTEGKNPTSVYHLAKSHGFSEADFYRFYNSFDGVAKDIWQSILDNVFQAMESGEEYAGFSVREKILTFYFTLAQEMKKSRSYISFAARNWVRPGLKDPVKKFVGEKLKTFFEGLLQEGYASGELVQRTKVSDYYAQAMILQFWFLLDFWIRDSSAEFEDTDAIIEKTVNLGFGMLQENTLDQAFDLARFLFGRVTR